VEITGKNLKKILEDQTKTLDRHNHVLYEKFRGDVKTLSEGWQYIKGKVDKIVDRQDIMGEKLDKVADRQDIMGEKLDKVADRQDIMGEKLEIVSVKLDAVIDMASESKQDISIIKSDISVIKYDLKEKVDRDEFAALEKRVILLENKIRKA